MDLETIFEERKALNTTEVIAFLRKKGRVRLSEAGVDLRVYYFTPFSGEMFKIYLYNDGTMSLSEKSGKKRARL